MSVTDRSEAAFVRHREHVLRYLRRRTGDHDLAEDLTQDVFLSAAAHLSRLDERKPVLAWLYTVAQSRLLDELRRRRRRPVVVSVESVPDLGTDLEFGADIAQALRRASLRLSGPDRELLALRLFETRSFADVARQLGVSEAAAKMRYLRTLRTIRAELEKEGIKP